MTETAIGPPIVTKKKLTTEYAEDTELCYHPFNVEAVFNLPTHGTSVIIDERLQDVPEARLKIGSRVVFLKQAKSAVETEVTGIEIVSEFFERRKFAFLIPLVENSEALIGSQVWICCE
ncbi:hypothetical protein [Aeoliella sp.]|uniref:hypothetical protein n=1 Tax=Aeoliella sp. TaxID=2795800 RepID=UPI003CCBEB0C